MKLLLTFILGMFLLSLGFVGAVGTYPAVDPNMVLYYHMNDTGTDVYDYSGNGNNGTANNTILNATGGILGLGSFEFNGVNSSVNTNIQNNIFNSSVQNSIAFWSYINNDGRTNAFFSYGNSTRKLTTYIGTGNYLDVEYINTTGTTKYAGAGAGGQISRGAYHYFTYVFNATNLKYYVDGILYGSVTLSSFSYPTNLSIGKSVTGSYYLNGSMNDFIVYNRSLTASEISSNYYNYSTSWNCSNSNANIFVNRLSGYIYSIIDKSTTQEILTPNQNIGIAYYSNGTWNNFNVANPNILSTTILLDSTNEFKATLRFSNYNITYDYKCYSNSFDIDASILKTDDLPVITNSLSDFQMRFLIPLNYTNLLNANMNTLSTNNFNIGKYSDNISKTMGGLYGSSNSYYIFNDSSSILIQLKSHNSRDLIGSNVNRLRTVLSTPIPFEYDNELLFFNSTYNQQNVSLSIVLGNSYTQSKMDAYNQTFLSINDSNYSGLWAEIFSTNISDSDLQNMYNNNVRFVQIQSWYPYYGYYPTTGTWTGINGVNTFNVNSLNDLADRIKSFGMNPFLYVNAIELQHDNATAYFTSSISKNSSDGYNYGIWKNGSINEQTYVMSLDNTAWNTNITSQLYNVVDTYSSFSGIFLDRAEYKLSDYAHTPKYSSSSEYNQTYDSVSYGLANWIESFSDYIHSKNMKLNINVARDSSIIQYADIITCDSTATDALINYRTESMGKYFYFMPISPLTIDDYLNYSIMWGAFPYYGYPYNSWINLSKGNFYLINKTANSQISFFNGSSYVKYNNFYALNTNSILTSSSNSDWYDMKQHKLVATNTNSYNYIQNKNTANLVYYNFTFGKYQLNASVDGYVRALDSNGNEIDNYAFGEIPFILNNQIGQTTIVQVTDLSNSLLVFSNGSQFPIYGTNQEVNLTLAPSEYVYVYTNYTYDSLYDYFNPYCDNYTVTGFNLILILTALAVLALAIGYSYFKYKEGEFGIQEIIILFMAIIISVTLFSSLATIIGGSCPVVL